MLYSIEETEKGMAPWEKILVLDPKNGDAKTALNKARSKKELVRGGTTVKPRRIDELNSEAMSAYIAGQLERASGIWHQALLIEPNNARIKNNIKRGESEMARRKLTDTQGKT